MARQVRSEESEPDPIEIWTYAQMSGNNCTAGLDYITSAELCASAVSVFGGNFMYAECNDSRPAGCFLADDGDYFLNTCGVEGNGTG